MLEAKLKALSSHLSQRAVSRENGRIKEESNTYHMPSEMTSMDLNSTIQLGLASHNHMLLMDLNGTVQPEPSPQFVSDLIDVPSTGSGDSCITKDDEQMIQVDLKCRVITLFAESNV